MKPAKFGSFLLKLLPLFALMFASSAQAAAAVAATQDSAPASIISYDKASDHLHVSVAAVPLKRVLGRIAQQSGIEVMFDDMADAPVSIDVQSDSLEAGIKRLLKGRNYMLRYSRDEQAKLLLIGVMVLPVGEQDTGRARRLVAMDDEAFYRARSQMSIEQVQQMDRSVERWQARMSEMPPEVRQRLEKKTASRLQRQLQSQQRHAEGLKKDRQQLAEMEEKRKQQRELALKKLGPEQRAAFEKDSKEASERMRVLLQSEQN